VVELELMVGVHLRSPLDLEQQLALIVCSAFRGLALGATAMPPATTSSTTATLHRHHQLHDEHQPNDEPRARVW
jgi:hypothetical protein